MDAFNAKRIYTAEDMESEWEREWGRQKQSAMQCDFRFAVVMSVTIS